MAAPMARVIFLDCCSVYCRNTNNFTQFCLKTLRHGHNPSPRSQFRTFGCKTCLQTPRALKYASPAYTSGSQRLHPKSAKDQETTSVSKHTRFSQQDGLPWKCDEGEEETNNNIRIYGDASGSTDSYRRQQERESLKPDAPNTARTLAVKIRKDRIQKKKSEEKVEYNIPDNDNDADESVANRAKGLDSKGFRTLRHQVNDLGKFEEDTVASILYRSIIYNEGDLVAIDKPYGLPSHGGPGIIHSVDSLLPIIAKKIRGASATRVPHPKLYPVHRLDKETTGVMLLAKTEEMAQRLHRMFIRHEVVKKYWLVTVGVPEPKEGIIDIPMAETDVGGFYRMGIRPDIGAVYKGMGKLGRGRGTTAVTNFQVVSENGSAALVEVHPETGVKHQIRVHMALGMGCPVLGDHKYSHHNKLAPQRLPMDMLQRLGIRQAKARTVPMHLHARELMLPEFLDGRNVFISTMVPKFFVVNMKRLKLKFPY